MLREMSRLRSSRLAAISVAMLLVTPPSSMAVDQSSVSAAVETDAEADCPKESPTEAEAAGIAIGCDREVLIEDASTEWSTSYATPSGNLRVDYSSMAIRQDSDGDGTWGEIDVAISDVPTVDVVDEIPEGMLPVNGGVEPIWLNPGGAAGADLPLAVVGDDDARVSMYSASLPITGSVTVDGRRASYGLFADEGGHGVIPPATRSMRRR